MQQRAESLPSDEIEAADVIALINDAAVECLERTNKPPMRAFVGLDALVALAAWARGHGIFVDMATCRGLRLETPAGPVDIGVRHSLYRHVIVEGADGQPWIAP